MSALNIEDSLVIVQVRKRDYKAQEK